jgi:hypothetical protein
VQPVVHGVDAVEVGLDDPHRRHCTVPNEPRERGGREFSRG